MVDAGAAPTSPVGGTTTIDVDDDDGIVQDLEDQAVDETTPRRPRDLLRNPDLWLIVLVASPFVVSALALIFAVGGDYLPVSDHALTEMQTRDVGRHPVLVGLYSRADWNHPGPMLFYVLAPFYRLTGGSSIGMNLGTLAINGASVVGMAVIARRRGGTPLLLCTLLGCSLLMRTLGADFLNDPWNCFVTVLPFGLMIFLTWALMCGDAWALPFAVVVASFLAQTHVGYVAMALPLLALGAAWIVIPAFRDRGSDRDRWRRLVRPGLVAGGVGAVLWLPVVVDTLVHEPNNTRKIFRWFRAAEEGTHTFGEGWRVITGQFAWKPEWMTDQLPFAFPIGQSPFQTSAPLPVMLLPLAIAAVVLWRSGRSDDRKLVALVGFSLAIGMVAVARTVGVAFNYRLRWTWVPPMVAFVLVAWTVWRLVAKRWPSAVSRGLVPIAVAGLVVLTGVNTYTGATAGVPMGGDAEVIETLTPQIMEAIGEGEGQVVVDDPFQAASWYMRGVVLRLERLGVDVKVNRPRVWLFGEHRVVDDDRPVRAQLFVMMNDGVPVLEGNPDMELIARWQYPVPEISPEDQQRRDELDADYQAGRITVDEYFRQVIALGGDETNPSVVGRDVAVFMLKDPQDSFG